MTLLRVFAFLGLWSLGLGQVLETLENYATIGERFAAYAKGAAGASVSTGGSSVASALCPECKSSLLQTPKHDANVMFVSPKGWTSKRTDDGYILQDSSHQDALRVNIRKGELKGMMALLQKKTKLIRAAGSRDTRYERETQAPMVWLHLNGNHGKFLSSDSGAGSDSVVDLFIEQGPTGNGKFLRTNADSMLKRAYGAFETSFPHHLYGEFLQNLGADLNQYANTTAATAYTTVAGQTRCKQAAISKDALSAVATRRVQPIAGGASLPVLGMDVAGSVLAQLQRANGPAAAQAPAVGLLAKAALTQLKGVLQTAIAVAVTDIPPAIPPPAWNNQPFPCMPMATGGNCFGAVQYPITIGDFVLADVSDSALDGVVASFPAYYRSHVGTTDDATYQKCFSAYMSMQCANAFPVCTTVQAAESEVPFVGRGPMCFTHCIQTLISCPGMWIDDLDDVCRHVSAPPVCSFANYNKAARPQLKSFDESQGSPLNCPA